MKKTILLLSLALIGSLRAEQTLEQRFESPPESAQPGVYWYFLNGNLNDKEMTADLESMKAAGLGNLVFLEVDLGNPPGGPVAFMSPKWQELFVKTVRDAERLGLDITLGIGPGWCGSGGPWVKPEQAMQHLVFSAVDLKGPQSYSAVLPLPTQRSTPWHKMASPFYEDVAVFAFPSRKPLIADIDEKALFKRDPYSIRHAIESSVKPYLPTSASYIEPGQAGVIQPDQIVDLTKQLKPDGTLDWNVPAGDWTIVRMGRRVTGASSRPAPSTAIGLESDKFDAKALEVHLSHFVGVLLDKMSPRAKEHGLTSLHMDSWESGAQNWTLSFLDEFKKRRGYDARPWLLTYSGRAVESLEKSERFLWDLRMTAQELVLENHAGEVKKYAHKNGLLLSIEPYDMNPAGDLDLGAVADVPMAEFWKVGNTVNSAYSVFELSSVGHVMGKSIVSAESFTSDGGLDAYPWSLKNQGDWAFCVGINRFVFHTFAHQALGDAYKPGMAFGPYGVHWHRNQTWWP
ncbi:MAG: glycosyl hydrolase, partial [Spartobacteria bacterium]|nr:glycosyl hydrolase [Spartobacteria bacterium]